MANGTTSSSATCQHCATTYAEPTWMSLELVMRIDRAEIAHLVVDWPPCTIIEVRRCRKCGASIATKRSHSLKG